MCRVRSSLLGTSGGIAQTSLNNIAGQRLMLREYLLRRATGLELRATRLEGPHSCPVLLQRAYPSTGRSNRALQSTSVTLVLFLVMLPAPPPGPDDATRREAVAEFRTTLDLLPLPRAPCCVSRTVAS